MALQILQIVVGILLIVLVLVQSRSAGLSGVFGGSGGSVFRSKRGMEKYLFHATIFLSIIMVVLTLYSLSH